MIRKLALAIACITIGALSVPAQHPGSHARVAGHDKMDHSAADSAHHAAMHALLHGTWNGTLTDHGVTGGLSMTIDHDSLHSVMLSLHAEHGLRAGAASDFAMKGDTVQWTQVVAGKPCKATAVISVAATLTRGAMTGTLSCSDGAKEFAMQKKAE